VANGNRSNISSDFYKLTTFAMFRLTIIIIMLFSVFLFIMHLSGVAINDLILWGVIVGISIVLLLIAAYFGIKEGKKNIEKGKRPQTLSEKWFTKINFKKDTEHK